MRRISENKTGKISKYKRIYKICVKNILFRKIIASIILLTALINLEKNTFIFKKFKNFTSHYAHELGLELNEIEITGIENANKINIYNLTDKHAGDNILKINLQKTQKELKTIEWVKTVEITKKLPNKIKINIVEYRPEAIWQNRGNLFLVDSDGKMISKKNIEKFKNLPIIVGSDALYNLKNIMAQLSSDPELKKEVSALIRVGGRRWDIQMRSGIKIKLPERNVPNAINYIVKLHKENQFGLDKISTLDLRVTERVFIKPPTQPQSSKFQEIVWQK